MSKQTLILVAVGALVGGTAAKPFAVEDGEELTDAKLKKLGLDADEVAALRERGAIAEIPVRAAGGSGDEKGLAAAVARAEQAEAALTAANERIAKLEKQLEEATKPAPAQ